MNFRSASSPRKGSGLGLAHLSDREITLRDGAGSDRSGTAIGVAGGD